MLRMKRLVASPGIFLWAFFVLTSAVWVLFPQIDLYVSGLFYTEGVGFTLRGSWVETGLYDSVRIVLFAVNIGAVLLWLFNRFSGKNVLDFNGKKLLFALLVLGIGSGLIVNALFKDHWGRARPGDIVRFGGDDRFTPAFILSDQGGYSFSCGHASGAFALVAYAMLARRRRLLWMALTLGYGFAVGLARMVAGGHFLSDVMVSFFVVIITAKMLHYWMFERPQKSYA